ncbi:NAD-P-binding protein [Ramaria rubella]|nr:NAD-P-binding protein [Ramaria rubella]
MLEHSGKFVIITGCSAGGIGHALAKEYISKGLRVFATARRLESMEALSALGATTMELDVTDISAIRRVRDEVAAITSGRLDILVNNAGQGYDYAVTDMDMAGVRKVFEVNLFGAMSMVQEFVPLLIASGNGRIIQMSSLAGGIVPLPFSSTYNSSKAALTSFGDTLGVELAPFNVKVTNVISGIVKSNLVNPATTLPPNSLYAPMEADYRKKRIGRFQEKAMDTDEFARVVVGESLKSGPRGWLWAGNDYFLARLIFALFPQSVMAYLTSRVYALDIFAGKVKRGEVNMKRA